MTLPVPSWLKEMVGKNKAALRSAVALSAEDSLQRYALHTVCHAAKCPNRGECFNCGDATFMVLGERCTRGCRFCAVSRETPLPPDSTEPERVAQAVDEWHIRYAVLTMPTRDDLPDGGAAHFARVINAIHTRTPDVCIEPLISDLQGNQESLKTILSARPNVLAHNVETVEKLYPFVRAGAQYKRTLTVLENSKKLAPHILTKSGFMVGLGETQEQISQLLGDLRSAGVDLLTIGQYLAPSAKHYPVARYPEPEEYKEWEKQALSLGFKGVAAGPLVRSSYRAGALFRAASAKDKQIRTDKV
ncbi:lipoyl synthase [Candidatus Avelusimicrobium luingense]|uniref:lipoyl synthase n=1 Tax=Candidatus Avelusimicrobium luingense TaxID=3416211 RepID=UPI003D11B730